MKQTSTIIAIIIFAWTGGTPSLAQDSGTALQQVARVRADLEVVREDQRKLHLMQQENRRLLENMQRQLNEMSRRLEQVHSSTSTDSAARQDVEALRRAIRDESRARERAIETVIDSLSKDLAAIATSQTSRHTPAQTSRDSQPWSGPVQGEYTVVRGDTLSAIAQAFGISVNRLKQANNLQGDLIREGQVMVIPK